MKLLFKSLFAAILLLASIHSQAFTAEIQKIKLPDGETTTARLCLPEGKPVSTIVVTIQGTGPQTYLTKRQGFNYCDVLAEGFCEKGVGFFTYNRRGVDLGETAPLFDKVDSVNYAKYLPHTEASDVETLISHLKNDERFKHCKIILYGISEGTIIASMVAERENVKIDALLLHGYAHESMFDIIQWQNSGEGMMIWINSIMDKNGDQAVDRAEYEAEDPTIKAYRDYFFPNAPFESANIVKDTVIDIKDIRKMRETYKSFFMSRFSENDGIWIWNNYMRLTLGWFREHFALEPNKTRLLRVDVPIYIFHGKDDINVPAEGVYDLEARFKACGKSNLKIFVFDKHNHDLNFQDWIATKQYSQGLKKLFETSAEI